MVLCWTPLRAGAESLDGITWERFQDEPIFSADVNIPWEADRVSCPSVVYKGNYYFMFLIGFHDIHTSAVGVVRSVDGISQWERFSGNSILTPSQGQWDDHAVYIWSYPLYDGGKWRLW